MPIITKPASIEKNSPAEVSLDKSALAAVASVAANAYYSDSTNWKEVFIYYKSSIGNQREVLKFNATISSPVATFLVSEKARDIFQVQKIVIVDFDNGSITVPRSQLTVADFDVDMTPAVIPQFLTFEYFNDNAAGSTQDPITGEVTFVSTSNYDNKFVVDQTPITGNFRLKATVTLTETDSNGFTLGVSPNLTIPFTLPNTRLIARPSVGGSQSTVEFVQQISDPFGYTIPAVVNYRPTNLIDGPEPYVLELEHIDGVSSVYLNGTLWQTMNAYLGASTVYPFIRANVYPNGATTIVVKLERIF